MPSSNKKARLLPLAAVAILALTAGAARADPIPENVLDNSRNSCLQACTNAGKPQDKCTHYCDCGINSVEEKLTYQEYTMINSAAERNERPPQSLIDRLQRITDTCRAQTLQ